MKYTAITVLAALLALTALSPTLTHALKTSTIPEENPKFLVVVQGPFQEFVSKTYCNGVPIGLKVVYKPDTLTVVVKPVVSVPGSANKGTAQIAICVLEQLLSSKGGVTIQEAPEITTTTTSQTTTTSTVSVQTGRENLTGSQPSPTSQATNQRHEGVYRLALVLAAGVLGSVAAWMLARW